MSICDNISKKLQNVLQKSNEMKKSEVKLSSKIKSDNFKIKEITNDICSCAMRWQTKGKARNKIQEGREVILVMVEETVANKKTGTTTKVIQRAFSRCKKTVRENGMCWKHFNSKNILNYEELRNKSTTIKNATGNEDFFKKKGKLIQPSSKKKSNIDPILIECMDNNDLYNKLLIYAKELLNKSKNKSIVTLNFNLDDSEDDAEDDAKNDAEDADYSENVEYTSSTQDAKDTENDIKDAEVISNNKNKSIVDGLNTVSEYESVDADSEDADSEDDVLDVEREVSDVETDVESDSESIQEIETTDGRKFYVDSNNIVYEPEDDDEATPFGRLIEIKYKSAPFHLQKINEELKYYICGTRIDVNDEDSYWRCKISNKVYSYKSNDDGLHDYEGNYKEKVLKNGDIRKYFLKRGLKKWSQAVIFI